MSNWEDSFKDFARTFGKSPEEKERIEKQIEQERREQWEREQAIKKEGYLEGISKAKDIALETGIVGYAFGRGEKIGSNATGPESKAEVADAPDNSSMMTCAQLAKLHKVKKSTAHKRLERARLALGKPANREFIEFSERKKNEDKYLYNPEWAKKIILKK